MTTDNKISTPMAWDALWTAMGANPDVWFPTTQAMYLDMLECVPPRRHRAGAFLVGEAHHDNAAGEAVFACFAARAGVYRARYMTIREFDAGDCHR